MFTEEVHLMQNKWIRECHQKGRLPSCILKKILELARRRGRVGWPFQEKETQFFILATTSSCTYMLYCIGHAWCLP